jgi:ferrous iron transport protein B
MNRATDVSASSRPPVLPFSRPPVTVALLGNPNTGKTTLFNALSGLRQRVGNYPGVTVEKKKGRLTYQGRAFDLIDLPGTYSLAPRSPDEMVAVDLILGQQPGEPRPDVVVTLVDASNLERNLYLTTQVLELGVPVVVALNMVDVAEGQGIRVDAGRLQTQLGVRVVPIQANKGKGLDRLRQAIAEAASAPSPEKGVPFPEAFEREVAALGEVLGDGTAAFLVRRLLLDVGGHTERRLAQRHGAGLPARVQAARQRLQAAGCPVPAVEARARYAWIRTATAGCVERPNRRPVTWTDHVDRALTHQVGGTLVFLALMFVVFQALFTWAKPLMDLIDAGKDIVAGLGRDLLPPGPFTSLLVDGVVTGAGSVIIFLPQIVILFGFLAVLEDCGYMARAAFLMDKLMARCGLSGKSFIPMLSSVACAVPGILATRVIEDRRDRLATILVAPLMSCSARLPVYVLLIGAFLTEGFAWWVPGLVLFAMYAIGLVTAPLVALLLKRTLLRGETPVFVMEMPLYKWPSPRTVLRRMTDSGWAFLRRAGTLILASMVLVWALLYFPRDMGNGQTYDLHLAALTQEVARLRTEAEAAADGTKEAFEQAVEAKQDEIDGLYGEWKRGSILGRMGRAIEPVVRPLGWDWKIGMAALASFPAREVVVGTLGIIYNLGEVDAGEIRETDNAGETRLAKALRETTWEDDPERQVFSVPVALSLMVFFALCCQCASTLAVIRRETNGWGWPVFTFVYMTVLAYVGALAVYQIGRWFV